MQLAQYDRGLKLFLMSRRTRSTLIAAVSCLLLPFSAQAIEILETIDFPEASVVQVRDVNSDGDIVGYRTVNGLTESFIRTEGGTEFFQIDGANTLAIAINDAGDTVGGVNTDIPGQDAFARLADTTVLRFNPNGNTDASANGINNLGVIVGSGNAFGTGGFLRQSDGTVTDINYPGAVGEAILKTNATDINEAGLIVGHTIGQSTDIFARGWYTDNAGLTFTDVSAPGQQITYVWAANNNGLLVGDYSSSLVGERLGFVFEIASGNFSPFSVPNADWTVPTGINDAGQIVGFSRDAASGRITGFVAVVPEPTSLGLMVMTAAGLLSRRSSR
ncbi:PEP-CTERM sorting domain-containing protein [Mucisphaera sp.]|uniref:PEP-CTERM sorting domain-containing protein n=1 Tax=Mucisphaera sp. TaxID=2913024 RepID=UPI003D149263